MTSTAKVDEQPVAGAGVAPSGLHFRAPEYSSPSAHSNPIELDPQALWKENQQLRRLLHEATVRLQYVDVVRFLMQMLSLRRLDSRHYEPFPAENNQFESNLVP